MYLTHTLLLVIIVIIIIINIIVIINICFNDCNCFSVANKTKIKTNIRTCDDVFSFYQYKGYKIEDCLTDQESKSLFWRVDTLSNWTDARAACRASFADLAVPKSASHRSIVGTLVSLKVHQLSNVWWHSN